MKDHRAVLAPKQIYNIMTLLEIAAAEIGKEEIPRGSNWGPHVKKYLASVGITFPASWCMGFVYWCCQQAGLNIHKSGGVLAVWNNTKPEQRSATPAPGYIFIQDHGKGLGHTGIVEKVSGDSIHTIEGNTNDTGSREGYEVCRRARKIKSCKGFVIPLPQ